MHERCSCPTTILVCYNSTNVDWSRERERERERDACFKYKLWIKTKNFKSLYPPFQTYSYILADPEKKEKRKSCELMDAII